MKKILLLGATGRTGKHVLRYALDEGYEVTALVRDPSKLTVHAEALTIIQGTPTNLEDIRKSISGCDAIISTLNNPRASDFPWSKLINPPTLMADSIRNCAAAMKETGVTRIVVQSAIGAGDSWQYAPVILRWIIKGSNMKVAYADHDAQEKILKQSNLRWTIVRPVGLTNSYRKKSIAVDYNRKPGPVISRRLVAMFMVDALATESYDRKDPMISEKFGPFQ